MSDFIAAFDSSVFQDIVRGFYWVGAIPPGFVNTMFEHDPAQPLTTLEVYLDEPAVTLERFDNQITVRVRQFVVVRAADIDGEQQGLLVVHIPLRSALHKNDAGVVEQFLRIDVPHLSDEHVLLTGISHSLYAMMIQGNVLDQLRQREPIDLRITPDQAPTLRSRLHLSVRPSGSSSELHLLANLDGRDEPEHPEVFFLLPEKSPVTNPHPPSACLTVSSAFLLAELHQQFVQRNWVAGSTVLDGIDKKLIDLGFGGDVTIHTHIDGGFVPETITLPVKVDFFSPTVQRIRLLADPEVSFEAGAIRIKVRVEAIIKNAPDATIDISARVAFQKTDAGLQPVVLSVKADFDATVLIKLAAALFGPIGGVIAVALDGLIDAKLTDKLKKQPIPEVPFSLLPEELELTKNPDPKLQVWLSVSPGVLEITPSGISYRSAITVNYTPADILRARYIRGNTDTFEAHLEGCPFGDLIGPKRLERFITLEAAIAKGYDPCRNCAGPAKDGTGSLRVQLDFVDPHGKSITDTVHVDARRVDGPDSPYLKEVSLKQPMPPKGTKNPFFLRPLANGKWQISVSAGAWTTTIQKKMKNKGEVVHLEVTRD